MHWATYERMVGEINERTGALLVNLKDWAERAERSNERRRMRAA